MVLFKYFWIYGLAAIAILLATATTRVIPLDKKSTDENDTDSL